VFGAVFALCAALLAYALWLQHAQVLEPCPMCILQRYAFIAIGVTALIAAVHDPRGAMLKLYGALVILFALAGAGVAARHSWLQRFPVETYSCGADLGVLLNTLPLARALPAIFEGTGECSEVQWRLLGLSIPEWALVWFVIFAGAAAFVMSRARRERRLFY
jgi:disulfide bond formation protein DsbB